MSSMRPEERARIETKAHLGVNEPEPLPRLLLRQTIQREIGHHLLGNSEGREYVNIMENLVAVIIWWTDHSPDSSTTTSQEDDLVILCYLSRCFTGESSCVRESTEDD